MRDSLGGVVLAPKGHRFAARGASPWDMAARNHKPRMGERGSAAPLGLTCFRRDDIQGLAPLVNSVK